MPPTANSVVVFSSINIDMTLPVSRSPTIGETMHTKTCISSLGGKGANVAIACARSGLPNMTALVSCIGSDGRWILDVLSREGIDTRHITVVEDETEQGDGNDKAVETAENGAMITASPRIARTGRAFIIVDDRGRSTILVDQGANACVNRSMMGALTGLLGYCVLVTHLEVPAVQVCETICVAHAMGATTVLNASPWKDGVQCMNEGEEVWKCISVIVVNEIEMVQICGVEMEEEEEEEEGSGEAEEKGIMRRYSGLIEQLQKRCATDSVVVLTLGAAGVLYQHGSDEVQHLRAVAAEKVVDTTGAGDTLTGYFAAALANGFNIRQSLRIGMAAAAKTVQKVGAVDSIPTWAEISDCVAEMGVLKHAAFSSSEEEKGGRR